MLQGSLLQARRQDVLCGADLLCRNASSGSCRSGDDTGCSAGAIGELAIDLSNRQKPAIFAGFCRFW